MSEQDVCGLLYELALQVKREPDRCIFSRHDDKYDPPLNIHGVPPSEDAIDMAIKFFDGKRTQEVVQPKVPLYPARQELFSREQTTPSIFRLARKDGLSADYPFRLTAPDFVVKDAEMMAQASDKYYIDVVWQAEGIVEPELLSRRMGRGDEAFTTMWPGPSILRGSKAYYSYVQHKPPISMYP